MKKYAVILLLVFCSLACSTTNTMRMPTETVAPVVLTQTITPTTRPTVSPTATPVQEVVYECTVAVGLLNVRIGPGNGYEILDTLEKGATIQTMSISEDWYKIKDKDEYISGYYLTCEQIYLP